MRHLSRHSTPIGRASAKMPWEVPLTLKHSTTGRVLDSCPGCQARMCFVLCLADTTCRRKTHNERLTYLRELQTIIENYKDLNGHNCFWANFDPDTCTWNQVQDELNKVEDEYQLKAKRNPIRRAFRGEGLTRNLTPILEGIPENDGLGLLKGGLIILFNVGATPSYLVPTSTNKHCKSRPLRRGLELAKRYLIASVKFQIYSSVHMKPGGDSQTARTCTTAQVDCTMSSSPVYLD